MGIREKVINSEKEGKIVIMSECDLQETTIENLLDQSTDGVLCDLNRDEVTCLTWMDEDENISWINNYACAKVIRYLIGKVNKGKDEQGMDA